MEMEGVSKSLFGYTDGRLTDEKQEPLTITDPMDRAKVLKEKTKNRRGHKQIKIRREEKAKYRWK